MKKSLNKDEILIKGLMAGLFMFLLIIFSNGAGSGNQPDSGNPCVEITEIKYDAIQVLPLLLPEFEEEWIISDKYTHRSAAERDIIALLTNSLFIAEFKLQSEKYLEIKARKDKILSAVIPYLHQAEEIPPLV